MLYLWAIGMTKEAIASRAGLTRGQVSGAVDRSGMERTKMSDDERRAAADGFRDLAAAAGLELPRLALIAAHKRPPARDHLKGIRQRAPGREGRTFESPLVHLFAASSLHDPRPHGATAGRESRGSRGGPLP